MLAEAGFQFIGEWTQDPESQINIGHGLPKAVIMLSRQWGQALKPEI